eukprot:1427531-Amphidinium_carterae.1
MIAATTTTVEDHVRFLQTWTSSNPSALDLEHFLPMLHGRKTYSLFLHCVGLCTPKYKAPQWETDALMQ